MNMFFDDVTTMEELKATYKKLAMKYHPDLGGSTEQMQALNAEYEKMLKKLAFCHNATESTEYDWSKDEFAEIIQKIITFEIDIEIIGTWIWCFNSYAYKEQLKDLGFWFSKTKKAWVYSGSAKSRWRSKNSVDDLREKWGSEKVKTQQTKKIS
jgi:hypothetical protein